MKLKPVEFLPAAQLEASEAAVWYEGREHGLGERFHAALQMAERFIRRNTQLGTPFRQNTRKWRVPDFPFNIVYREEPARILVIAIAHQARHPAYWRKRLRRK